MYRADKILLCTGWCYVQREVGVVTVVVSPSARSDAGGRRRAAAAATRIWSLIAGSARQAFCSRRILGKRWPRSARTVARFAQALTVSPSSGLGSSAARRRAQNRAVAMPNHRCG